MKIHFHLHYRTIPGETLHVLLYRAGAGANEQKINIPLTPKQENEWEGEIQLQFQKPLILNYYYEVRRGKHPMRREWRGVARGLTVSPAVETYYLQDSWRDLPRESWLYSAAVTRVWKPRKVRNFSVVFKGNKLIFHVQSARPRAGEKIWISGSTEVLGNWDPQRAVALQEIAPNEWEAAFKADAFSAPFEYKFLIRPSVEEGPHAEVLWEQGENRTCPGVQLTEREIKIIADLRPVFEADKPVRVAGVEVPLFSLRSANGWGCGDLGDLVQLIDWAAKTGQRAIELLPLHDTIITRSWRDSSPYRIISSYAFHPMYADVRALAPLLAEEEEEFEQIRAVLNQQPHVNYEGVLQLKLKRLERAFELEGKEQLASAEFRAFFQANEHWLPGYAMFCVLRDRFGTADTGQWPKYVFFAKQDAQRFCALGAPDEKQVRFWYFVQFVLHTQLRRAAEYARAHGVVLIADVPLGVSRYSADVWMEPSFFRTDCQTGTPPDEFCVTGQNWEIPPYDWDALARDGYHWWSRRMTHLATYFDAYRLDHVQGFCRMWEIPHSATQGLLGQYVPARGFSVEELAAHGLPVTDDLIKPYISQTVLEDVFGVLAQHVAEHYLQPVSTDRFALQEVYNTQRKITDRLGSNDPETSLIRRGLCELAANVLFVEDIKQPGVYHPRVDGARSSAFFALPEEQQQAYRTLYADYFTNRQNETWRHEAFTCLPPVVNSVPLLCCGEDLGVTPPCLPEVAGKLGMLLLEVQRLPKEEGRTFGNPAQYPYLSVATPGTHDMSVLRAWWQEDSSRTQHFWVDVLGQKGDAPVHADYEVCEAIVRQHLQSPAMLVLLTWQDWASVDTLLRGTDPKLERINDPANENYYWRYRMPIAVEDLLEQAGFNQKIKALIEEADR